MKKVPYKNGLYKKCAEGLLLFTKIDRGGIRRVISSALGHNPEDITEIAGTLEYQDRKTVRMVACLAKKLEREHQMWKSVGSKLVELGYLKPGTDERDPSVTYGTGGSKRFKDLLYLTNTGAAVLNKNGWRYGGALGGGHRHWRFKNSLAYGQNRLIYDQCFQCHKLSTKGTLLGPESYDMLVLGHAGKFCDVECLGLYMVQRNKAAAKWAAKTAKLTGLMEAA